MLFNFLELKKAKAQRFAKVYRLKNKENPLLLSSEM